MCDRGSMRCHSTRRCTREYSHDYIHCFFFQAEDGIRDYKVTGVQTCALPICYILERCDEADVRTFTPHERERRCGIVTLECDHPEEAEAGLLAEGVIVDWRPGRGIGRGAWRERGEDSGGAGSFKKKKEKNNSR